MIDNTSAHVITVPQLCDLSGCWREAIMSGFDIKRHVIKACSMAHKLQVQAKRQQAYRREVKQ